LTTNTTTPNTQEKHTMKATKSQPNESPAAQLKTAQAELDSAQQELQSFNVHRGDLSEVATRRRELAERVEIARERLTLAQERADEAANEQAEREIVELTEQAETLSVEIESERARVSDELHKIFLADWLDGTGRFATSPGQGRGLVSMASSVQELESRRVEIMAAIRRRENLVSERREQRAREAAAVRADARKRLIAGGAVPVDLSPWRVECLGGFIQDVADSLARKIIPSAMAGTSGRTIHCLLPEDSKPGAWCDGNHLAGAEQIEPAALCGPMAAVWARATPSKNRAASR
jgi:hypothetical protein